MLKIKNISKTYKTDLLKKSPPALNNLSFGLEEGSITGFLGHNGSGKTTLIKIIMGFCRADSGRIQFSEKMGKKRKDIFKNIGYLPERPYFYPYLTGIDFLKFMAELMGIKWIDSSKRIKKYAARLHIEMALEKQLKGYSKGMLQRIGFLANLILEPKLIILDEPLSGLDPIGRKEYKEIIKEVNKEGATIFFSSHIVHDVEEISKNIVIIEKGELVYDGSISSLYEMNKRENFVIKYLENEEMKEKEFEEKLLKDEIDKIYQRNGKIFEVSKKHLNLEEIVYKLK